jgi:hypothetical protein
VPGRELRGADVVDHDVVEPAFDDAFTEQHHRRRRRPVPQVGAAERQRVEDQPVEHRGPVAAHHQLALTDRVTVGLVHHDRVARARRLLDHGPGQLGEVRHVELGQHQRDQSRPAVAQRPGDGVRLVPQLVERALHPGPGLGRDLGEVVDHVRHRPDRDAGPLGDFAQGGGHCAPRFPNSEVLTLATLQP